LRPDDNRVRPKAGYSDDPDMGLAAGGIAVRRVGFRVGTDAELAAMHLVESEIEAERRPGASPQPLGSYIAFARHLPAQFDDHTWLAETSEGTPVGCSACWSNSAGDPAVMECYVYVRKPWRRRGAGWQLARTVVDAAAAEGRSRLVGNTFGSVPAGAAFAARLGARAARVNRTSSLSMREVDWDLVQSWIDGGRVRAPGYWLDPWDGPFPSELAGDAAAFHHMVQAKPRDDLQLADVVYQADDVAELDRALVEAGRQRWTIFVRDISGRCVGGTEVTFEPWDPALAVQQNTAIDEAHRGRGLAKWAKASMLDRIRRERPGVERVRTSNAFSNAPMLAINAALGFTVTETRTEWQGQTADLRRALLSRV
jgi:mycothiol synthase